MFLTYRYKPIKRKDGTEAKLPHIPIEIKGDCPTWIQTMALVDSGADRSVIPKDLAELINLDLSGEVTKANGIGGEVRVIRTKMKVRIGNSHGHHTFEHLPVEVILQKTKAPMILGRDVFFDKFIISFNHLKEKITLKRNHKSPGA